MKNNENLKVRAQSVDYRRCIEFLIMTENAFAKPIVMKVDPNFESAQPMPTFKLSVDNAQLLMDDLWQAGLRPSEGTGSAGALLATQKHLEDMRTLVFKSVGL